MVNATELKIGNLVLLYDGEYYKVIAIEETTARLKALPGSEVGRCDREFEDLDPINLSPEILEKCGFGRVVGNVFGIDDFAVRKLIDVDGEIIFELNNHEPSITIHYLHQLQNLYFALTGEELPITF